MQCQESPIALADLQPGSQATSSKKSLGALTIGGIKKEVHHIADAGYADSSENR